MLESDPFGMHGAAYTKTKVLVLSLVMIWASLALMMPWNNCCRIRFRTKLAKTGDVFSVIFCRGMDFCMFFLGWGGEGGE